MAGKKISSSSRIPASELAGVKDWHLPQVDSGHVVRSPFQEKKRDKSVQVTTETLDVEPLTVEAIEKLREQAQEEGYREGHSKGLEQGLEEGRAKGEDLGYTTGLKRAEDEINALKAKLDSMMSAIAHPLEQQESELEQALLRLVVDVSKAVIKSELSTRPELMQNAVAEILKTLPHGDQNLAFTISSEDQQLVEALREKEHASWELKIDDSMQPGGLTVKGVNSYVDYSVEHRFEEVAEQLLNSQDEVSSNETDEGSQ